MADQDILPAATPLAPAGPKPVKPPKAPAAPKPVKPKKAPAKKKAAATAPNPAHFMACSKKQFGVESCQCAKCAAKRINL